MNYKRITLRFTPLYIVFLFLSFLTKAQETNAECYKATNAGAVGEEGWTGCADMYIVANKDSLVAARGNGHKITHGETDYTFADGGNNIFTGQVTDMSFLFANKTSFNQDIGYWDTSRVTTMASMFQGASAFDQNIGSWNTASVTDMSGMFLSATSFNQDLSGWDVSEITSKPYKFDEDATAWTNQNLRPQWGTASINDPALQALSLYPNPVTSNLYIDNPLGVALTYTVYDLTGRQLATHQARETTHSLDISSLPTGSYLLKATSGLQFAYYRFVKE